MKRIMNGLLYDSEVAECLWKKETSEEDDDHFIHTGEHRYTYTPITSLHRTSKGTCFVCDWVRDNMQIVGDWDAVNWLYTHMWDESERQKIIRKHFSHIQPNPG